MSVSFLVGTAYAMPGNRIIGPDWTESEEYDIDARHTLPANDQAGLRAMLQHLLTERFSLRFHRETRPFPVYVLTKARDDGKLGPQLVSITGCDDRPAFLPSFYKGCGQLGVPRATTRVGVGRWETLRLHGHLEQSLNRIVVDETGLSGWYAALLEWSDDSLRASSQGTPAAADKPELFTALREQLGLKLEMAERPIEVIVIDSVERPTPN